VVASEPGKAMFHMSSPLISMKRALVLTLWVAERLGFDPAEALTLTLGRAVAGFNA
jgi:hypothetical protein